MQVSADVQHGEAFGRWQAGLLVFNVVSEFFWLALVDEGFGAVLSFALRQTLTHNALCVAFGNAAAPVWHLQIRGAAQAPNRRSKVYSKHSSVAGIRLV